MLHVRRWPYCNIAHSAFLTYGVPRGSKRKRTCLARLALLGKYRLNFFANEVRYCTTCTFIASAWRRGCWWRHGDAQASTFVCYGCDQTDGKGIPNPSMPVGQHYDFLVGCLWGLTVAFRCSGISSERWAQGAQLVYLRRRSCCLRGVHESCLEWSVELRNAFSA